MYTTKTFNLGTHIWFHVTLDGDKVLFIEEHDWHEGGGLPKPTGRDWTQDDFVGIVLGRFTQKEVPEHDWLENKVREFLASDATKYDTDKDPECPWVKKNG
jgi:galactose mutarotase-like enzyme